VSGRNGVKPEKKINGGTEKRKRSRGKDPI
jgi:hypothetical protein